MAKPYRNKLNLFLTLNCHLELLGYLLFIYLFILVSLAFPGAVPAILGADEAMGNGFLSPSIMFTSEHSG